MKIDKEDSPALSGFIFLGDEVEIAILEVLETTDGEEKLAAFLEEAPTGVDTGLMVLVDFSHRFINPRQYHTFDCAVKKFKFNKKLDQILRDPAIYVQNSHLSNCFTILNQLNQLRSITRFEDANEFQLWPSAQSLEMANAKLGSLLSMEELAFPPRSEKVPDPTSSAMSEEATEEEVLPDIQYATIKTEAMESPPHGLAYFVARNSDHIAALSKRRKRLPAGCIASDGETEIWTDKDKIPHEPGWIIEPAVPYFPLAQAVGPLQYPKLFRIEDGTEIRGDKKFYSFSTPRTTLPPMEVLRVDKNNESWQDGDRPLATCDVRWMSNCRGPVRSTFADKVHPKDEFNEWHPLKIEEPWKPPIEGLGPTVWATRPVRHVDDVFHEDFPEAKKCDSLLRHYKEVPPLTVQEEYHDPILHPKDDMTPRMKKKRFNAVFPSSRVKLGATDSTTVRTRPQNLPPIQPAF
jgi:hypothetical protein